MKAMAAPILVSLLVARAALGADDRVDRLPPEQRHWLEEEVNYIITEAERETFLSIETTDVRSRFIEAFWRRRDPNRATIENEFRDEHYRRLAYANDVLGRETARPGYRTDRGRYYILLGEPREIQRYEREELQPIELWFYDGDGRPGLPPFFYLLFFKPHTTGEFELYHPTFHGPTALVIDSQARAPTNRQALEMLRDVSVELGRAALSFDPSERAFDAGAISSAGTDVLLARVDDFPRRSVRTDYLDAWRRYGGRVSADYSFNFVPSRHTFAVLAGPDETSFLHYSIEIDPQNFNLEADEDGTRFYTVVDLDLQIRSATNDALVVARQREVPIAMTRSQFDAVQTSPVAIQGAFPIVSGDYVVSLVARNRVLKQFAVAEQSVHVPVLPPAHPALSDLVLGFRVEAFEEESEGEVRPFQVEGQRIHPASEGVFALGETVYLATQLFDPRQCADCRLTIEVVDEASTLSSGRQLTAAGSDGLILEPLGLDDIADAGNYEVRVTLTGADGRVVERRAAPLVVSPRTAIARAGYLSRVGFNAAAPGLLALERAEQLLGVGRFEEGRSELERAVAAENPDLPEARWKLAALLINSGEIDRTIELLAPLEADHPNQFEVIAGLGFAHYHRLDFEACRVYLERAVTLRAPYEALLNTLADCYERSGDPEKALVTFERSLELNQSQPAVSERVEALRASGR